MKNKSILNSKMGFLTALLFMLGFNSYGQWLPIGGGNLTGNLSLSQGYQLQTSNLSFNASYGQPGNSSTVGMFPNTNTGTLDIVGWTNGWHFVPNNGSLYPSPVVSIDAAGNTSVTGNLLLGTPPYNYNPKLLVYQSAPLGASAQNATLLSTVSGTTGSGSGGNFFQENTWMVRSTSGNDWLSSNLHNGISVDLSFLQPHVSTLTWWERNPVNDIQSWGQQGNTELILKQGALGIGTENPLSLLQVDDGCSKASIGNAGGSTLNYGTSYLGFNASRIGTGWVTSTDAAPGSSGNNGGGVIYGNIIGDINFAPLANTNGPAGQTLQDGDVAGKITFKIAASGITYAKQIVVQAVPFPDYVFNPTYHLMPLASVQSYIDQNGHLPEVPSAAEVEKDGLNLGEMNKLLLKKVEELTLYLIEQNKRIDTLEKKLKTIKP